MNPIKLIEPIIQFLSVIPPLDTFHIPSINFYIIKAWCQSICDKGFDSSQLLVLLSRTHCAGVAGAGLRPLAGHPLHINVDWNLLTNIHCVQIFAATIGNNNNFSCNSNFSTSNVHLFVQHHNLNSPCHTTFNFPHHTTFLIN